MRARGAKATDIAILVVAADDGVMPQTVEAINHAQAADVPIVVAVNKIDKEGADPARSAPSSPSTDWSPRTSAATPCSSTSRPRAAPTSRRWRKRAADRRRGAGPAGQPGQEAQGVAIEAHLDRGRGPVATVLIQRGTLRVGDSIVAGDAYGRVRAMVDEHGEDVDEAYPSRPVQVIGFTSVPGAGDNFLVVDEDRIARQIADRRSARKRNAQLAKRAAAGRSRTSSSSWRPASPAAQPDPQGRQLRHRRGAGGGPAGHPGRRRGGAAGHRPRCRWHHRDQRQPGVGLGCDHHRLQRPAEGKATELANREGVEIRYYSVIYQAIDEIESALKGMLKPIYEEKELGRAEIREIFRSSKVGNIAGWLVQSGNHAQRQGAAAARQRRGRREPHRLLAQR